MSVGELLDRKDRPAYVRFERVAIENKTASVAAGHFVGIDVDMALITPPYSKDVFKIKVPQWFENMKQDVANGRMQQEWADQYKAAYKAFQNGQEMPLNGTPIRGWGVLSPAQQETLIQLRVLTVEDLAGINDEGMHRLGMGAVDLKNKAKAWLAQLQDKGPLTIKMAAIEGENAVLKGSIASLEQQIRALSAQIGQNQYMNMAQDAQDAGASMGIGASDILDDPVAVVPTGAPPKRGRPPKQPQQDEVTL